MTTAHQTAPHRTAPHRIAPHCTEPHRDPVLTGLAGAPVFFERLEAESRKARSDVQGDYVSRQMDALFADGARPKGK